MNKEETPMKTLAQSFNPHQAVFRTAGLFLAAGLLWTLIHLLQPLANPVALQSSDSGTITEPAPRNVEEHKRAITSYLAAKYHRHTKTVRQYVDLAFLEAAKHPNVPPELPIAVMLKESSLDPKAKSGYGAEGLMQVVRRMHPEKVHRRESLLDPRVNIRVGAQILQQYIAQKGRVDEALVKYSGNADGYADFVLQQMKVLQAI